MGGCCGKADRPDEDDHFQGRGRTLADTPAAIEHIARQQRDNAPVPARRKSDRRSDRRTGGSAPSSSNARTAAAQAAEARATAATQGQGKLGKKLSSQKGQTQNATLAQNARENLAYRQADAAAAARNHN